MKHDLSSDGPLVKDGYYRWYQDMLLIPTIAVVFLVDQITKQLVRDNLIIGESIPDHGFLRIAHVNNSGSAFGFFSDQTIFLVFASMIGIGILLIVFRNQPFPAWLLRVSLGLQMGGALGNLLDRILRGGVTDFIRVGFWPVFNMADAGIVVGLGILMWLFVFVRPTRMDGVTIGLPGSSEPLDAEILKEADVDSSDS